MFARLAFSSRLVALLTGLLCAANPFWVINTGQVEDGVVTSFLLACGLVFGTRSARGGAPIASLLFGLALAALALMRAALLPFAFIGLLWFVWRCREVPRGWLYALLATLGFVNGIAPWVVRKSMEFHEVIPVADSAWLHLWMGNNPRATGAELDDAHIYFALPAKRREELLREPVQPRRYQMLATDTLDFVAEHPDKAVKNRIKAGLCFYLGGDWFPGPVGAKTSPGETRAADTAPDWLRDAFPVIINGVLFGMLAFALLGWRWTFRWHRQTSLAALALIWVPLPYVLSHAESLWGPRLPLDGLLLCFAAFALVYLVPILRGQLVKGPEPAGPRTR
jgi:hypothetical protein